MRISQKHASGSNGFKTIEGWSSATFSNWLRAGIGQFYVSGSYKKFEPVDMYFQDTFSLTNNLLDIYSALTPSTQTTFQLGLGDAMASEGRINVAEDLIEIATAIKSKSSITAFPAMFKKFANSTSDESLRFITQAIIALSRLAMNIQIGTEEYRSIRDCLKTMTKTPAFHHDFSGVLLVTLCKFSPDDVFDHSSLLQKQLTDSYGYKHNGDSVEIKKQRSLLIERLMSNGVDLNDLLDVNRIFSINCADDYGLNWWKTAVGEFIQKEFDVKPYNEGYIYTHRISGRSYRIPIKGPHLLSGSNGITTVTKAMDVLAGDGDGETADFMKETERLAA